MISSIASIKYNSNVLFLLKKCKKVFDIEGDFSDMLEKITGIKGFEIKAINLSLNGLCQDCTTDALS